MHTKIALTYFNFNSNLFALRDKIKQDLTLKNSIYNIKHRPSQQDNSFSFITQRQSFSNTSKSIPNRPSLTKRSYDNRFSIDLNKVKAIKHTLLSSKQKVYRLQTEARDYNNSLFQKRLNRITSPYSKAKIKKSSPKIEMYKQLCRKVKPNKESMKRNNYILYKLPHIYFRT